MTVGAITITPVTAIHNTSSNSPINFESFRHKDKYKELKRERDRDYERDCERNRDRDRGHHDRSMDRLGLKDERMRRDSGAYIGGHFSGNREEEHWMIRDRDSRDPR